MLQIADKAKFSELFEHNSKVSAVLSPKGNAVADAVQSELLIWNVQSKKISHNFVCDYLLDFIKWSPDSELICCGKLKEGIQVWNIEIPHWRCKITGCLSFLNAYWSPDSQYLIVVSEFYIKATIFSLVSSVITEIDNLKAIDSGFIFSPCEKYLVVAQRINYKDYLGVYSCHTWEAIKAFQTNTENLVCLSFSPTDPVIAVLDSVVEYKALFYSIDGRLLGKCIVENGFGLLSLNWSLSKKLIALGDSSSQVKILNSVNYELLTSYQHPDIIESSDITVYRVKERPSQIKSPQSVAFSSSFALDEVEESRPFLLMSSNPDVIKENSKNPLQMGVQILQFSKDGKYIATVMAHLPKAVFVYDVQRLKLCNVIARSSNIKKICWHPVEPYFILCSSSCVVDIWTPECCLRYIPAFITDFPITNAVWSPKSNFILLNSREHFSILYLEPFS